MVINKEKLDELFQPRQQEKPEDEQNADGTEQLNKPVGILVQPSPDPDCLGAAAGMSVFFKEVYGLSSEIYHFGVISHPQNKSMKNVLHISLKDSGDFDPDNVCRTVVLDTDLENSGFKTDKLQSVDVRIDHHSMDRDEEPKYKDVRAVGSTCAIVWDYLREFDVDLSKYSDEATALVLGIKTDTLDFTSANTSELDMEAYRNLLPFVNKEALARVTNFPLPKEVFEMEASAYSSKNMRATTLVSFIGEISAHSRDNISTIADRFARMAGVNTVVIMAVIDDCLQASVRSDDSRVDVNDLCVRVFGKKYAGAKEGAGGARLPLSKSLEYINDKDVREIVIKEIVTWFENKIFNVLGEETSGSGE